MPMPISNRKLEIVSKLEYAEHRRNDLMNELFSTKYNNADYKFIAHVSSEVLSVARETFDYLCEDIVQQYLIPSTTNKKVLNGKQKIYFPFHVEQVKENQNPLHELKTIAPNLYIDLLHFVEGIATKETIPNSLFNYSWFLSLKDMINMKKHTKLTVILSEPNQEILLKSNHSSILLPKKKQLGWDTLVTESKMIIKEVPEYRFSYNNIEVGEFCLFAVKATELIMEKFYSTHFD